MERYSHAILVDIYSSIIICKRETYGAPVKSWNFPDPGLRRNKDLLFNVRILSVLQDKKVLEMDIVLATDLLLE